MSFLSGEAMFRALVSKNCYVTGSLRTIPVFSVSSYSSTKSVSLWAWNGEGGGGRAWSRYVLKRKKEEPFFALAYDISSYAERKLKTLQAMGEVYSVLSSQSLAFRLIIKPFPTDYICCQSGQVLSG